MANSGSLTIPAWMGKLDATVETLLDARDVFQERTVDVADIATRLEVYGFRLNAIAEAVMHTLGGLTLTGLGHRKLKFDAVEAASWFDESAIPYARKYFSDSVTPVATTDFTIILVSADGTWWALDELWIQYFKLRGFNEVVRLKLLGERTAGELVTLQGEMLPAQSR
ncbi:hypothetical protein [Myxococcus eversor]|uniref:hypothetical protein n=1 Tax=Myxococcus eversor TaxID=2709661 RepID=UPI0013CF5FA6|nr:hypothetical protein [Myxococcus eversor]